MRPMQRILRWLVAHPWLSMALVTVLSLGAAWWGKDIPIRGDMEELFPEDAPSIQRAQRIREVFKSRNQLTVLVGGPSQEANRAAGTRIADTLRSYDVISAVEFRRDVSFFEKNALLFVPIEDLEKLLDEVQAAIQEEVKSELGLDAFDDPEPEPAAAVSNPSDATKSRIPNEAEIRKRYNAEDLSEYFESPDGQVLAVKAYPTFKPQDSTRAQALTKKLKEDLAGITEAFADSQVKVTLEGDYSSLGAAVNRISEDLKVTTGIALAIIASILLLYFRRLRALLLVLIPLGIGLAWTLFAARATIGHLNLITAVIFAIVLGLGIDFVVHAASRMDEEFRAGRPLEDALPTALARLGRAMLAAAITTMSTFAALGFLEFRGFSQFGIIAALGVAMCLAAVYFALPPLAMSMHRVWPRKAAKSAKTDPASRQWTGLSKGTAWALVLLFTGLTVTGGLLSQRLDFEADTAKLRPPSSVKHSKLRSKYLREAETRTASPAYVLTDGLEQSQRVHRHATNTLKPKYAKEDLLTDVVSIFSFVPEDQEKKLPIIAEIKRKIDQKYQALEGQAQADADSLRKHLEPQRFGVQELPDWVKEKFTDAEGELGRIVLLYQGGRKANAKHVNKLQAAFERIETPEGDVVYSTANYYIFGDAFKAVKSEAPLAVGIAGLVVLLLLSLDLRSARDVALVFVPIAMGFVIMLGLLALANIQLNIYNIIVLPTVFGIGVDTAIHLMHRLREGASIGETIRSTGLAAAISTATTAAGFFALTFVSIEGMRSIGWVAVLGLVCCYLSTLTMTTALVALGFRGRDASTS